MRTILAAALMCLTLAACGPSIAPAKVPTVTGHAVDFYRGAHAETTQPHPTLPTMVAWGARGDGNFDQLTVQTDGEGGFTIGSVTDAEYYLQLDGTWFVSTSRELDLDVHGLLGHPASPGDAEGAAVTVSGTGGIDAKYSLLEVFTPDLGPPSPIVMFPGPTTGDFTGIAGSFTSFGGGLPAGTPGQESWVSEKMECVDALISLGGAPHGCMGRGSSTKVTGLAVDPSATVALDFAFEPRTTQPLSASFDATDALAHASDVNPGATPSALWYGLFVTPNAPGLKPVRATQPPLLLNIAFDPPSQGTGFGTAYADPFPAEWSRVQTWSYVFATPAGVSGGSGVPASLSETRPASSGQQTVTARLSPPTRLTLDGAPAASDGTLAGLSPRLEWQQPAFGTPKGYLGIVYKRSDSPQALTPAQVFTFVTAGTHFQLPPGLLLAGSEYVFSVVALDGPELDVNKAPLAYRWVIDLSMAQAVSGTWATP
ncbi:MAG: hypothetical protein QM723_09110 [Myxococcaceae bacterium]